MTPVVHGDKVNGHETRAKKVKTERCDFCAGIEKMMFFYTFFYFVLATPLRCLALVENGLGISFFLVLSWSRRNDSPFRTQAMIPHLFQVNVSQKDGCTP